MYQLPPLTDHKQDVDMLFRSMAGQGAERSCFFAILKHAFELRMMYGRRSSIIVKGSIYGLHELRRLGRHRSERAVFFPLGAGNRVLNTAGYFIGVRSGLCDIISSSACKKSDLV